MRAQESGFPCLPSAVLARRGRARRSPSARTNSCRRSRRSSTPPRADEQQVTVEWQATTGYYLYKKRMGLSAATAGVTVGESVYPKGEVHKDDYFGEQEVFRGTFKVTAPLTGAKAGDTVALKLKWQGCADAGLCYPPSVWDATVKVRPRRTPCPPTSCSPRAPRSRPEGDDEFLDPDVAYVLTAAGAVGQQHRSSTGASPTATTSTRSASSSSLRMPRSRSARSCCPRASRTATSTSATQEIYRAESRRLVLGAALGRQDRRREGDLPGLRRRRACAIRPSPRRCRCRSMARRPPLRRARPARSSGGYVSEQDSFAAKIASGSLLIVIAVGYLGGLLHGVHALRAADGADPVGHHRRQRRQDDAGTRVPAVSQLCRRHRGDLRI